MNEIIKPHREADSLIVTKLEDSALILNPLYYVLCAISHNFSFSTKDTLRNTFVLKWEEKRL